MTYRKQREMITRTCNEKHKLIATINNNQNHTR